MPTQTLISMAQVMFEEGFTKSEAYPLKRWQRNGWPEIDDPLSFKVMDAYLKLQHLKKEYEDE